jgi:outer membrane protein assembly factor BamA
MTARQLSCLVLVSVLARASVVVAADSPQAHSGMWHYLDPTTAPFIPVPEIDVDPNSGTTLGLIPTWLTTNKHNEIERIIAPDILYNPNFGYGARGRIFAYPSDDEQWSIGGGAKQRVESEFDAEYWYGRTRQKRWSFIGRAVYDRSGTPRFFGIGNDSPAIDETNYTNQQKFVEGSLSWNLTNAWQVSYTMRARAVEVRPGSLAKIQSIEHRFRALLGVGLNHELLNRVSLTYDTRDDLTVPRHGTQWVVYAGIASSHGLLNASLYSIAGIDARHFWSVSRTSTLVWHFALRYMPEAHKAPFWALSSIGGDRSVVGAEQPLRAFGTARFYDRNAFSASVEYRERLTSFNAFSTRIDLELAPFVDVGHVFARANIFPVQRLHHAIGLGVRGVASPFVVGYVDIGYGSEGAAVFTGINYPF